MLKKKIALVSLFGLALLSSCGSKIVESTICDPIYSMDTTIFVRFYNVENTDEYYQHIKSIFIDIDKIADNFNSGESKVSVYDLNHSREAVVDDYLLDLLKLSEQAMIKTNGYFNPYIGRLAGIWKDSIENKDLPSDNLIKSELEIMNNTSLEIDDHNVKIIGDGNIDLGGIAKGYATKLASDYLAKEGVTRYFINAGESSISLGDKNGEDFNVMISSTTTKTTTVAIKNASLSTSSPKYQYFEYNGSKYHHLISPITGYPLNNYDSITIYGVDNALGDAYSTAMFSMDYDTLKNFTKDNSINAYVFRNNDFVYLESGVEI